MDMLFFSERPSKKIHNSHKFLTSAVLKKIFIASSTTNNSRSIGSHLGASTTASAASIYTLAGSISIE